MIRSAIKSESGKRAGGLSVVLRGLLGVFSNIWTGVSLFALLFVYSSIGSALYPVRQSRFFEMTEFEWFHWWPFKVMIILLFLTLICTTLRRIRFNRFTLGVWMAHSGVLILGLGSWIYFSTKVEGDVPVIRRSVLIEIPGAEPVRMVALPGASVSVFGEMGRTDLRVTSIDPDWEILSDQDKGKRAYAVNVMVSASKQHSIRQVNDIPHLGCFASRIVII